MSLQDRPVIVGGGLAGLLTALHLAPEPTVVVTPGPLGSGTSSDLAQGGIAAALHPGDSPTAHALDTLKAGTGLSEPGVVAAITDAGPQAIAHLEALGARFDRDASGDRALALEGAHSRPRVVHAGGDATGAELVRAAVAAVRRTRAITVLTHSRVIRVMTDDGEVSGVVVLPARGEPWRLRTSQVVLATGGIGGLFGHTTNPVGSRGQGLALAARAGAVLRDVEMVQFHPTALDVGADPMPLVTEAVRGAGARLVDRHGQDLVADPLAGRDAVARAVWAHLRGAGSAFLDARESPGPRFARHFPTVAAACHAVGLDPAQDLIPVRPAAHYHMGGVAVDQRGRSTVPGLWAVGEVASTGLHGANRLASNSLLEAAVCARSVAEDLQRATAAGTTSATGTTSAAGTAPATAAAPAAAPAAPAGEHHGRLGGVLRLGQIRRLLSDAMGVEREPAALSSAAARLRTAHRAAPEDDDALVALMLTTAALRRRESRGAHLRTDAPLSAHPEHLMLTLDDVLAEQPALERSAS